MSDDDEKTKTVVNCLTPGCPHNVKWKGICTKCYGAAKRLIESGQTTWEELFNMGMVHLDDQPFLIQFKKLKGIKNVGTQQTS